MAIVNAVAHRDYQIRGDEIRLFGYSVTGSSSTARRLPGHMHRRQLGG